MGIFFWLALVSAIILIGTIFIDRLIFRRDVKGGCYELSFGARIIMTIFAVVWILALICLITNPVVADRDIDLLERQLRENPGEVSYNQLIAYKERVERYGSWSEYWYERERINNLYNQYIQGRQ